MQSKYPGDAGQGEEVAVLEDKDTKSARLLTDDNDADKSSVSR